MFTIYGRQDCVYCEESKKLLDRYGFRYEYKMIGEDIGLQEFVEKYKVTSVPLILEDDVPLGNYNHLQERLKTEEVMW